MSEPIVVTLDGKRYTWNGTQWYGTTDYTRPPLAVAQRLNGLVAKQVQADDEKIIDPDEQLQVAKQAQGSGQLLRALRLAQRSAAGRPDHLGTAAVLCSILRELHRPAEAVTVADQFRGNSYPPLLTSRAAALCDLGRWEEALNQIRQVLAIKMKSRGDGGGEALAVYSRIKSNAPELFDS